MIEEVFGEPLPPAGAPQHRQRGHKRARMLARFDANGDGQLQPAERQRAKQAIRERKTKRFIQRFDTNRDGNVGPEVMPRGAARKLRRLDANGDGWVQPGERRGR